MKKISLSKYSYLFEQSDEVKLIYNSVSNMLIRVNNSTFLSLKSNNILDINDRFLREKLNSYHIIVGKDENAGLFCKEKFLYYKKIYDTSVLRLTILPTGDCNFCCSYCFESKKTKGNMSDVTIQQLISFIKKKNEAKKIAIMWFGGEPLVAFRTMSKIVDAIKKEISIPICDQQIVTNGYLIDNDVCNFFNENKFSGIQITIDGNKSTHDKSRFIKHSLKPTFDVILSNISLLIATCPNLKIKIRVNVSQDNVHEYMEVNKLLTDMFGDKVVIYPGIIRIYNFNKDAFINPSLSRSEQQDLYWKDEKLSLSLPKQQKKGCLFSNIYTYVIGVNGELYKCWEDINNLDRVIGHLSDGNEDSPLRYRYEVGASCFDHNDCQECLFFPICTGGCPRQRTSNIFDGASFDLCSLYKDNQLLDRCLQRYYSRNTDKVVDLCAYNL